MAGKRMIHDKLIDSHKVNAVSFEAEALFVRLITKADDNGNYYRDIVRVYAALVPEKKRATPESTEKALRELIREGLLIEYEGDERKLIHIVDFEKHQELRKDLSAQVAFPLHPAEHGPAYSKNGERRDNCIRPGNDTERAVTSRSEPETPRRLEVEVQEQVQEQVEGERTELMSGDLKTFKTVFREQTGAKPKLGSKTGEKLGELCGRFGMEAVIEALPRWVEDEGGRSKIKKEWACANFLRDAQEIIEAMKSGVFDEKKNMPGRLPMLVDPY